MAEVSFTSTTSSHVPKCPNHGCQLLLDATQQTALKGQAPCEISGALFEFSQDTTTTETSYDKFGNVIQEKKWNVTGEEK